MLTLNFFLLCSLLKQTEWLIMYYPARVTIYQFYNLEHLKNWYLIGEIISLSQRNVLNVFIGYSSFKCLNTSSLSHQRLLNVLYIVEMKKGRMVQYPMHTSWIQSLSSRTFFFPENHYCSTFFCTANPSHPCFCVFAISPWLFRTLPGSSVSSDWKTDMNYSRIHKAIHFVFHS